MVMDRVAVTFVMAILAGAAMWAGIIWAAIKLFRLL